MRYTYTLFFNLFLVIPFLSLAQSPGDLDINFNGDGKVITTVSSGLDIGYTVAVQSSGKIVVAGRTTFSSGDDDIVLVRYNLDGTLDTTFGTNGITTTDFDSGLDEQEARSIVILGDDKIVIGGSSDNNSANDFMVAQFTADGILDSSFGDDGKVITPVGMGNEEGYSVQVQSDGKIVLSGYSFGDGGEEFALVRYNVDGSLDSTFGDDGIVSVLIGTNFSVGTSSAIQADNKILVGGFGRGASNIDFALARFDENGELDTAFSDDGFTFTDFNDGFDQCWAMALQQDGSIVLAGSSGAEYALARFLPNGDLDSSFGVDGKVLTGFSNSFDVALSLVIQPDGKIVAAGISDNNPGEEDFSLVRYNIDGSVDTTFGNSGIVVTNFSGNSYDQIHAMTLDLDNRIVVTGTSDVTGNPIAVARYITGVSLGSIDFSTTTNNMLIYPNPIESSTTLEYDLSYSETLSLKLYDVSGKLIKTFFENYDQEIGAHSTTLNFEDVSGGNYLLKLDNGRVSTTVKIIKK